MSDESIPSAQVAQWSETLAAIARTGLAFAESLYDRERYEEMLHLASDMHVSAHQGPIAVEPASEWLANVVSGPAGYVTPRVAVGAYVGNEKGELLLIQRSDTRNWFVPTGWADVGYSPAEVVQKEVLEETGYEVEAERVVAVLDAYRGGGRQSHWLVMFKCKLVGGSSNPHPLETVDVGWFSRENVPSPLIAANPGWLLMGFEAIDGEIVEARFDPPRNPVWRTQ